ncbi:AF4/FMR2 family member lilli-like [Diprion similis]|uniref:AF4/FMR2 family member lilli-like n=1 Tax=Diprion similis TaxID=362088 RepID=UPI001EF8E9C2|nr:AF4/FMR2 family member lilli-like [Diprion similis]
MGKTRGVHETTPELRNRMVGMYEAGLGLREIAAAVNCSQRTVKRWLNRFDKEGTVETRERCGRKRATTSEQDEAIIRLATQTPITAAKAVLPALGLSCSVDTVRERLHKAGIHNWSPSRKHMQRIPLGSEADSVVIQQSVWRPTGTQLGRKKSSKERSKEKKGTTVNKRKTLSRKTKSKDLYIGDGAPTEALRQPSIQPAFVFPSQQNVQQPQTNNLQTSSQAIQASPIPFSSDLTLAQQPVYQHPVLNVAQNWPLDLVQGSHHYPQGQPNAVTHEHPQRQQQLQELHTQQEQQQLQEQQIQEHSRQHNSHHQNIEPQQQHQQQSQQPSEGLNQQQQQQQASQANLSPTHLEAKISRIDSCSNSSNSISNGHVSDEDGELNENALKKDKRSLKHRKKKGGKAKGTLETSVEIRNRMIGMSEAGLSTLSIALAINRSERTVKRWLERWHKEGNVQTKERKGRRRITTKEQDEAIIAMATQHPLTAAKYVAPALGLRCSVDTIRERLHKAGIHSWKLGKKQGEGNAVHTVHLWQPSGNRPNKPKLPGEKKKKSSGDKKYKQSTNETIKRASRKKKVEPAPLKVIPQPANMITEQNTMQFHEPPMATYVSGPNIMHPVEDMSAPHPSSHPQRLPMVESQVPPVSQPMQPMGLLMQQRSDCRLAQSVVGPSVSSQGNPAVAYPPCMVGTNTHTNHIEQPDPLNYEPYMWNF